MREGKEGRKERELVRIYLSLTLTDLDPASSSSSRTL